MPGDAKLSEIAAHFAHERQILETLSANHAQPKWRVWEWAFFTASLESSESVSKVEIAERIAKQQFQNRSKQWCADLGEIAEAGPIGLPLESQSEVEAIASEFLLCRKSSKEVTYIEHEWEVGEQSQVSAFAQSFSEAIGPRSLWLLWMSTPKQAIEFNSDWALKNPVALAEVMDHELALWDAKLSSGLWLVRHSHRYSNGTVHSWEVEVWGESWGLVAQSIIIGNVERH